MPRFFKHYLLTLLPFVLLDAIWLGAVAPKFYQAQIGFIMTASPIWGAAIGFYLLYVVGLVVFVTGPAIQAGDFKSAAWRGALFGLMCYATYDLTNLATLAGWPVLVTIVDLCWGTFVTAATAVLAVWLSKRF